MWRRDGAGHIEHIDSRPAPWLQSDDGVAAVPERPANRSKFWQNDYRAMSTMNVSLLDSLKSFVDDALRCATDRAAGGLYL